MKITVTVRDDLIPALTALSLVESAIGHWSTETEKGNQWCEGAVISYTTGHYTLTRKTDAGWAVIVGHDDRPTPPYFPNLPLKHG
jgi:hypothetical protein